MSVAADSTHRLADLAQWSFAGTALAVLGRPVDHSLSPAIHNAALAELARSQPGFRDWRYFKFDVDPIDLPAALELFHRHKFHGLNLTVPHKAIAVKHLAETDDFVCAAGAANTLIRTATGWRGANTDGAGLSLALRQDFGTELAGRQVILLGAGGAARGAAVECLRLRCAALWIGNRTRETMEALLSRLRPFAGEVELHGFDLNRPPAGLPAEALVINATSLGLKAEDPSPIDLGKIPRPSMVYDMIYRPPQTALLRQASATGLPHANGLSMLVHQGARSLELWTGTVVPVATMQQTAANLA